MTVAEGASLAPSDSRAAPVTTPGAWRVAAAVALTAGIGAGAYAGVGRGRISRLVPILTAGVAFGCSVPVALASRRPPIRPEAAREALERARGIDAAPSFSIVVAARDEANVLRQLVEDVSSQDYREPDGTPRFELIVVDDRSSDGSGDAVREAAAAFGIAGVVRVVRREGEGLPDGKGAALTAAQPEICRGDVVLVLDADARIAPAFLSTAAGYFAAGADAVTARRRILDAGSSPLAGAQADEQTLDGEIQRGRWSMGGCSEFRGNGIMLRRELLAEAGGWRARALTEDVDLSSRVAAVSGTRVAWAIDAEVWEEPVRTWPSLWRQRQRWAEGAVRRVMEHAPAVLASRSLPLWAKLDFATYAAQLGVPPVALGAGIAAVLARRPRALVSIILGYLGISAMLGWDSLRWEQAGDGGPLPTGERAKRAARVTLFNGLWLLVLPKALFDLATSKGPIRYVKMEHSGSEGAGGSQARREPPACAGLEHARGAEAAPAWGAGDTGSASGPATTGLAVE